MTPRERDIYISLSLSSFLLEFVFSFSAHGTSIWWPERFAEKLGPQNSCLSGSAVDFLDCVNCITSYLLDYVHHHLHRTSNGGRTGGRVGWLHIPVAGFSTAAATGASTMPAAAAVVVLGEMAAASTGLQRSHLTIIFLGFGFVSRKSRYASLVRARVSVHSRR